MIEYCILRTSLEILKNVEEDYPLCQNRVLLIGVNCWYRPRNVIFTDSLLQRYQLANKLGLIGAFSKWDELSLFGIWDELSLGMLNLEPEYSQNTDKAAKILISKVCI